jgi:hypothetical protein
MAKQRGPHQLSGKINNLCYYTQKGVRGGLVRRINDGMSERLKVGEEFANTRRANSVFGMCSIFAGQIIAQLTIRDSNLWRADRQAYCTKKLFDFYKSELQLGSGQSFPIGARLSYTVNNMLNEISKNKLSDYLTPIRSVFQVNETRYTYSLFFAYPELVGLCNKFGVQSLQFTLTRNTQIYLPYTDEDSNKYIAGEVIQSEMRPYFYNWNIGDGPLEVTMDYDLSDEALNVAALYVAPVLYFIGGRPVFKNTGRIFQPINLYL